MRRIIANVPCALLFAEQKKFRVSSRAMNRDGPKPERSLM
jgi:hypothetical protein